MNALELRACLYLIAAGLLVFLGARLASLHYETVISGLKASDAALAAQAAMAAKAQQDAANANNAIVVGGLQDQLNATRAGNADLANRLRDAQARSSLLSQAANKPGAPAPSPDAGQRDLASVCAAVDTEDQANAARLNALISELKPQL